MALSDRIPIPPSNTFNANLNSCPESTMLQLFGEPGPLTRDCSPPTGPFKKRLKGPFNAGPFRVTGLDFAVTSLAQVFADVQSADPALFAAVHTAGMLCCRAKRSDPNQFSNHSWGTAIDIFFGDAVAPMGVQETHRGNLLLAPFFNKHGWYWGAGFSRGSVDSMHFELARETILTIPAQGPGAAVASANASRS
jgi:hypothetical protein